MGLVTFEVKKDKRRRIGGMSREMKLAKGDAVR